MPRGESEGGAGRPAVRSYREGDWEDFVAAVRDLPRMAHDDGLAVAVAFAMTELPVLADGLGLAPPRTEEETKARALLAVFFDRGSALALCDPTIAGFNHQTNLIQVVRFECYRSGVRAVFERSGPLDERPYVPTIPKA